MKQILCVCRFVHGSVYGTGDVALSENQVLPVSQLLLYLAASHKLSAKSDTGTIYPIVKKSPFFHMTVVSKNVDQFL